MAEVLLEFVRPAAGYWPPMKPPTLEITEPAPPVGPDPVGPTIPDSPVDPPEPSPAGPDVPEPSPPQQPGVDPPLIPETDPKGPETGSRSDLSVRDRLVRS